MRFFFNDDEVTTQDLRRRLDDATRKYVRLSMALTVAMNLPERADGEKLRRLDCEFENEISGVIRDLSRVYDGKIVLYPASSDIVVRMENYNAQIEELERVIKQMTETDAFPGTTGGKGVEMDTMDARLKVLDNPCIFVCGRHGAGKTSLISASTEDEDGAEVLLSVPGCTITQTSFFTYIEAGDFSPERESLTAFIARMKESTSMDQGLRNLFDNIRQVWYCVSAMDAQLTVPECEMFRNAGHELILVLTKSDVLTDDEMEKIQTDIGTNICPDQVVFTGDGEDGTFPLEMKKIDAVSDTIDSLATEFEQILNSLDDDEIKGSSRDSAMAADCRDA